MNKLLLSLIALTSIFVFAKKSFSQVEIAISGNPDKDKEPIAVLRCLYEKINLNSKAIYAKTKPIENYIYSLEGFMVEDRIDSHLVSGDTTSNQYIFTFVGKFNLESQNFDLYLDLEDRFQHRFLRAESEATGLKTSVAISYYDSSDNEHKQAKITCNIDNI